ncbi:transforming growth factor-beta-induced protein ig-h3-like [Ornithodoros turicata]|uniref:transforming growth factor-beta-induced protein ig-h3-like n=1 Tax=Ornithodoros turicata TaxID=34597 RepID=UPI003139E68E
MARAILSAVVCLCLLLCVAAIEREGVDDSGSRQGSTRRGGRFLSFLFPQSVHRRLNRWGRPDVREVAPTEEQVGDGDGVVWNGGGASAVFVDAPGRNQWEREDGSTGIFSIGFPPFEPWWKGPHICQIRNEVEDDTESNSTLPLGFNFHSKQCQETDTSFVCTTKIKNTNESKTITEKYVCCHGYQRRKDGGPGCAEVNLKDIMTTMKDIGASKFVELIDSARMGEEFKKTNVTVFSPTNIALKDFEHTNEVSNTAEDKHADTVKNHVVKGMIMSSDLTDEMVLETVNGRSSIRINEFYNPGKVLTANCVPVVSYDNVAQNGVVHVVDETLPAPSRTLYEIINQNAQFSTLKSLLATAGLEEMLKDPKGHYTILAPNDVAFSKVSPETLQKWKNGESCMSKLLRGHVLPHVICTTAIPSSARVRNVDNQPITMEVDGEKLYADGVSVVTRDIMGTNGVLHVVDELLMSQESKSLMQTLRDNKMADLVHLIESANMTAEFDTLDNFTFFAPSPEALKEVSLKEWEDMKASSKLAETFRFHTVQSKLGPRSFFNNMVLPTASGQNKIRVNVFPKVFSFERPTVTAQCARILSASNPVCGGTVYLVDKILEPPHSDVLTTMEGAGNYKTFLSLVKRAGMEAQLRGNTGPFTVLAPTDAAFRRLPKKVMDSIKDDEVESLVKQHILPEVACTSGVSHNGFLNRQEYRSLEGTTVPTQRSLRGNVYFGGSRVTKGDTMATNGVVHGLDRALNLQTEEERFGFGFDFHPFFRPL